jgi:Holliday junction resolvase RusA-like endonuclease
MTSIRFCVPRCAVGVNATYRVGRGRRVYKSPEANVYRDAVVMAAKRAMRGRDMLTGHVEARIWFAYPTARNDIDGAIKPTLDALNGIVWQDDRQVIRLEVDKLKDTDAPRVEIEVVEVTP